MKHRNKYIKYTATPVMYLLGAGFCMASLLGGCTEEIEVSPIVPDGTPVELMAEIAGTVQTKAAIPENNYDRSAFVAGDKILLVKSYGGSTAKTDYTLSADAATWTPPSANNPITLQAGATYQAVYPSGDPDANYILQNQATADNFRKSNKLMSGKITSRDGVLKFTGENAFTHQYTKITLTFKVSQGSLSGNLANTLILAPGLRTGGSTDESITLFRPDADAYSWCGIVYPKKTNTPLSLSLDYGGVTYKVSLTCGMQPGKHYNYTLTIENGILVPSVSNIDDWINDINSGSLT